MKFASHYGIAAFLFFVTALIWSQQIPLFEAPDELSHYRYAEFIAKNDRLPIQSELARDPGLWEGFQPPLYHVVLSTLIRTGIVEPGIVVSENIAFDRTNVTSKAIQYDAQYIRDHNPDNVVNGVYRLRFVNVLFGALFIWVCFLLMRTTNAETFGAQAIAVWMAFPAVIFSAATLSNDMLAALCSVTGLLFYARYKRQESIYFALLSALCFGLGLLTKNTVLLLWAALVSLELFATPRFRLTRARLVLIAIPIAMSGIAVARSLSLHPMMDPDPVRLAWINSSPFWILFSWPLTLLKSVYWSVATSVGVLGAQALWLPGWMYGVFFSVILVFVASARINLRAKLSQILDQHAIFLASATTLIMFLLLSVARFRESGETMHARLLLGYIPGIIQGIAVFGTSPDKLKSSTFTVLKVIAIFAVLAGLIVLLLPQVSLNGAISQLTNFLKAGRNLSYYADLTRRFAVALMICGGAFFFYRPIALWLSAGTENIGKRVVVLTAIGMVLNIGLLHYYVVPLLIP